MKKSPSLFGNPRVLNETSIQEPLKSQKQSITRLMKNLSELLDSQNPAILAYIGDYGTGKSVIINNAIEELRKRRKIIKIDYDIWQSTNLNNSWLLFLSKTISTIKNESITKTWKRLDGKHTKTVPLILSVIAFSLVMSLIYIFLNNNQQLLSFGFSTIALLFALIGFNGLSFIKTYKLSDIYSYEAELIKVLKKARKKENSVIIVIEDSDRINDENKLFLKTLRFFISNSPKNAFANTIIICPQKAKSFYGKPNSGNTLYEDNTTLEDSMKIYDEIIYSGTEPNISEQQILELLGKASCKDNEFKSKIIKLCKLHQVGTRLPIRNFKYLLRNVQHFKKTYPNADPSIVFTLLSAKLLFIKEFSSQVPLSEVIRIGTLSANFSSNKELTQTLREIFIDGYINTKAIDDSRRERIIFSFSDRIKKEVEVTEYGHGVMCTLNWHYLQLLQ